jgi:hypothetical protein
MDHLLYNLPERRRLFRTADDIGACGGTIVIPCTPKKNHAFRWLIAVALIVSLWGVGMAGQLATETLQHQSTAKLERPSVAGP